MQGDGDNGFGEWGGYMEAKMTKLEEQFSKSSYPFRQSNLFAGISIFVNGLTNPSADELKRIMMVHGGVYHHYQRSHTMFIIASILPDVKVRNMNTSKIISPQWVVDCLKENRIVDYTKYLLYTNHKPSQPKIVFQNKSVTLKSDDNIPPKDNEVASIMRELDALNKKIKMSPSADHNMSSKNLKSNTTIEETIVSSNDSNDGAEPAPYVSNDGAGQVSYVSNDATIGEKAVNNASNKSSRTANDPKFLSEFYNNSRLHHIATLGAGFKQYISELREKHSGDFPGRERLRKQLPKCKKPFNGKQVMHIDMDCFFVSVGLRSRAHLRGQPVAVTHSKGGSEPVSRPGVDRQLEMDMYMKRLDNKHKENVLSDKVKKIRGFEGQDSLSEIASCSYEARKKGVRNGMFVGQALKLCPELKTIPYDFEGYKEVAFSLYNTMAQYTLNIEAVSCDEMFVDLTELLTNLQVDVTEFVEFVRQEVKNKTGCPCSAGIGGNRLQARMATKKAKPDGLYFLTPESVEEYMTDIPIIDLPGVGYSTSCTLKENHWVTCGDLQQVNLNTLQSIFGKKLGETLHQFCRGVDNRVLVYDQVRKSVSAEVNYGIRFTEYKELEKFLKQLSAEVHSRLKDIKRRGKCITLKLMVRSKDAPVETSKFMGHGICDHFTKSVSLPDFTSDLDTITKTIMGIMKSLNIPPKELRGIGIQISKLDTTQVEIKKDNALKDMFNKVKEKQKEKNVPTEILKEETIVAPIVTKQNIVKSSGKSPRKNDTKTSKKTRGKTGERKQSKIPDVANMLQNASNRKGNCMQELLEEIDMNVLAELPEDIRTEILESREKIPKMQTVKGSNVVRGRKDIKDKVTNFQTGEINVDEEFLNALPSDIRKEIEQELKEQNRCITNSGNMVKKRDVTIQSKGDLINQPTTATMHSITLQKRSSIISEDNIFQQPEWRQLTQAWVESTNIPENCDVEILSQHARELIVAKKSHDLYVPIKFLCRVIGLKTTCSWHTAYKAILDAIQEEMKNVYGAPMYLNVKIDCDKCS